MGENGAQATIQELLAQAGVTINGDNAADIRVHNKDLFARLLSGGALALGESYMDGWWDCASLDQFFDKILRANLQDQVKVSFRLAWHVLKSKLFNLQKPGRAYQVGEEHYDIGNDLYCTMLDKRMLYTCGYWADADDLDAAQENWHFVGPYQKMTFASRMQHAIYWGRLKRPVEWSLKTWLAPWSYLASRLYHDAYWYPIVGRPRVKQCLNSEWGCLFQTY